MPENTSGARHEVGSSDGGGGAAGAPPVGCWLLTGGAGYIGSHVARALLAAGHRVVVLDDLSTGDAARVPDGVDLVVAGVGDVDAIREVLRGYDVVGVIHLAAKKAVGESVADPNFYYDENLGGLLGLLTAMHDEGVVRLVFSSSAAVYGTPTGERVDETSPTSPESPYGRTKLVGEWMVADAAAAYGLSVVSLRYFNVVGAAEPALADLHGVNLFPSLVKKVASGEPVTVFGGDYPTPDGTCVRDYIHVQDLAEAHVAAAELTGDGADGAARVEVVNIGGGRGASVLEVVEEFGRCLGHEVARDVLPRRAGDPAVVVADPAKAARLLGWKARFELPEMVRSAVLAAQVAGQLTVLGDGAGAATD